MSSTGIKHQLQVNDPPELRVRANFAAELGKSILTIEGHAVWFLDRGEFKGIWNDTKVSKSILLWANPKMGVGGIEKIK